MASAAGDKSGPGKGRAARKPKPSGRDPWRTAFFGVLALAIAGGAAWALLGSSLLVVRHEQVTGNRLVPVAKVLAAAGIRRGTPLASVNTTAAARRVEQIAQVRSARVTRSFPDTVVISVRERTPSLAVRAAGGYALTDGSGVTIRWSARKRPACRYCGNRPRNCAAIPASGPPRRCSPGCRITCARWWSRSRRRRPPR